MNNAPPYLFYLHKCPHCAQLIEMIKKNQQLAKVVQLFNVHYTKPLPPQLTGVPAILFRGQLLIGPETFKWVQFQTPQGENRPAAQSGIAEHPSISQQQQDPNDMSGLPSPADISSSTKTGIDFTPIPGKENESKNTTISRFQFLEGQNHQADGTVGIDVQAATEDTTERNRSSGIDQSLKQLEKLRGHDNNQMQGMQGGMMGMQQAPWQQQQQQQFGGMPQQQMPQQQGGYMQQMPQQQQMPYQQQQYMQQGGMPQQMQQQMPYQQQGMGYM